MYDQKRKPLCLEAMEKIKKFLFYDRNMDLKNIPVL